ncbi:unnamed protein product [Brachionus calyciflorus]|uniref:Uncharacterized protein n=1 Tax=Brachionus calyciflorus TaxID=104777 RepID=A0A813M6Y5_9BILA|nr:unnamed protein product [Brachionus calyciflorus]
MIEEQISFWMFMSVFAILSIIKTLNKFIDDLKSDQVIETQSPEKSKIYAIENDPNNVNYVEYETNEKLNCPKHVKKKLKKHLVKSIINYSISFNSSFLVVGALSEAYLFGIRMIGNIISVFLGQIYSFFIIHSFMYSFGDEIKTPYEYLEKRYNKRYLKSLSSFVGMLFYFMFLSLYLWGCTAMINILLPELSMPMANLLLGIYSIFGTLIGGLTQSTKTNIFQFVILCVGLVTAIKLTLFRGRNASLKQLWHLAELNQRTTLFDKSIDLHTRYTILNQVLSLPLPWCSKLGLFIADFMRYKSIEPKKKSKILFLSNIPVMIFLNFILLLAGGLVCFLYFFGCDPLKRKQIQNKNQIGIYWLHLVLSRNIPSLSGILFASIIYYSVIQHSLGMALCSKTVIDETLNPYLFDRLSVGRNLKNFLKKLIPAILGTLSILMAYAFQFARNTMLSLFFVFNNSINSPLLGLFLVSMFNPYANHAGVSTAFVVNLIINFWIGSGSVIFSRTKSQEFPTNTLLCDHSHAHLFSNMTKMHSITKNYMELHHNSTVNVDYYPKNQVLLYLYSIAPIWYCLFSVLFNLIFGSLFSLIYSYVKTRSFDCDAEFSKERKKYLFYYRYKKFF